MIPPHTSSNVGPLTAFASGNFGADVLASPRFAGAGEESVGAGKSYRAHRMNGHIEAENPKSGLALVQSEKRTRILLLQGLVGPFFAELQKALSLAGIATRVVVFNTGDTLFTKHLN
jgi:hypothetical protein